MSGGLDSGRTVSTSTGMLNARDARSWLIGRAYGSVGLGLGTAIGAAIANPNRRVALFCGDGGFMMGMSALDVARQQRIDNLTVVILNDRQLGSEVKYLKKYDMPRDVVTNHLPDIPALASVFGGVGTVLETDEQLDALQLGSAGLQLIDARLDPDVDGPHAFA